VLACVSWDQNGSYVTTFRHLHAKASFRAIGSRRRLLQKKKILTKMALFFSCFSACRKSSTWARELFMVALRCPNMHKLMVQSICSRNITVEKSSNPFGKWAPDGLSTVCWRFVFRYLWNPCWRVSVGTKMEATLQLSPLYTLVQTAWQSGIASSSNFSQSNVSLISEPPCTSKRTGRRSCLPRIERFSLALPSSCTAD
jgi:hypothetical protein